jgi:hypothetical protein
MMKSLPSLEISNIDGFNVVRGDLIYGGIKFLCLVGLLAKEIEEKEVVYCAHAYGHSGLALGLAGKETGKRVTLFFAGERANTYVQEEVDKLENVQSIFLPEVSHQSELVQAAKDYTSKNDARYLPVGFDEPLFTKRLIFLAQSLDINPHEVWTSAGSGTTARCLRLAWPEAKINIVNLGMMPSLKVDADNVYSVPEEPEQEAELPPPYPSAIYYDAKIWRFIQKHAKPGALVWNIA